MDQRREREIRNYVVDASVVAKWVLPIETYQENAFALREDKISGRVGLYAPSILTLEVTNTLWKAVKLKKLSEEESQEALKTLADIAIPLSETDWQQASEVLAIACELDITIYDASYVFLSEKLQAQLITSDTRLYEKAKGQYKVLHLRDYI